MRFTCKTSVLAKAVQTAKKAISSNPSTPIFSGIHLIASTNQLEIQAMDLNMAIGCQIEANVAESGTLLFLQNTFLIYLQLYNQKKLIFIKTLTNLLSVLNLEKQISKLF